MGTANRSMGASFSQSHARSDYGHDVLPRRGRLFRPLSSAHFLVYSQIAGHSFELGVHAFQLCESGIQRFFLPRQDRIKWTTNCTRHSRRRALEYRVVMRKAR